MSNARILVVEDDEIIGMDVRECLDGLGYDVIDVVTNGDDAVRRASAEHPSLVLMDIMLQGEQDGISAAGEIHSELNIPIVFLTSLADNFTFTRAKAIEPYGYVIKPFKQFDLQVVIELALNRFQTESIREHRIDPRDRSALQTPDDTPKVQPLSEDVRTIYQFLLGVEPFNRIDRAALRRTAEGCRIQNVPAGDLIAVEGEETGSAFLVMSGRIGLIKSSPSGRELVVEIIAPRDPLSLVVGIDRTPSQFSAKAQVPSTIVRVPYEAVSNVLGEFPAFARGMMDTVINRLWRAHDLARALAHDCVEARMVSTLLAMSSFVTPSDGPESGNVIRLSRQELADMTGMAPETASRVANALEREGLLDLSRTGLVRIVNRNALSETDRKMRSMR